MLCAVCSVYAYTTFSVCGIIIAEQDGHFAFLNREGEVISGQMYEKGMFLAHRDRRLGWTFADVNRIASGQ